MIVSSYPFRIHWNGVHYYYTTVEGTQVTKGYKTVSLLKRYGLLKEQQKTACLAPAIAEDGISAYIEQTSLSYSHEKSVTLFVDWELDEPPTQEQQEALESLERTIEQDRLAWCKKIYRALKEEYEYLTSDECIAESLEANELEFMEDGTRFNAFNAYALNQP